MRRPTKFRIDGKSRSAAHAAVYRRAGGLTLIELLVAAVILAILAAAVLPSLLTCQTRAKIAASRNNLRVLADALEVYYLDYQSYPFPQPSTEDPFGIVSSNALRGLTTPVAYVGPDAFRDSFGALIVQVPGQSGFTRMADDPFRPPTPGFNLDRAMLYFYYPSMDSLLVESVPQGGAYAVVSVGPDLKDSFIVYYPFPRSLPQQSGFYGILSAVDSVYDPTNGTISGGDLAAFGGALSVPRFVGGGQ